jgi:hypothetical protein
MKFTLTEKEIKQDNVYEDPQSSGTESYHRVSALFRTFVATDGVAEMCQKLKCFWVMDVVASYLPRLRNRDSFFTVKVTRDEKGGCQFTIDNGSGKIYVTQDIPYTDLTYDLKLFLSYDGELWVIMLPSEY